MPDELGLFGLPCLVALRTGMSLLGMAVLEPCLCSC